MGAEPDCSQRERRIDAALAAVLLSVDTMVGGLPGDRLTISGPLGSASCSRPHTGALSRPWADMGSGPRTQRSPVRAEAASFAVFGSAMLAATVAFTVTEAPFRRFVQVTT